ncbi:ATP-binding cassette sub-family C member 9-like isoform X1 [Lytechinus pictus]|uniref:ATP-binding cassette sub-family C member 9-like isoform X1 n=1 Tax=Lytechinus pictus TaxID=7653 RepID=UPI0030B9DD3E
MMNGWDWFCGVNYTLDSGTGLNNSCLINGIIVVPQLGFVVISSLILLFLAVCSTSKRQNSSKYLLHLPGHTPRWLLTYVLLVLTLSFLAEGILTNDTYLANSLSHQPHLYVVGVTMFLGAMLSIVYYHMMEKWRERHMVWLLFVYWITTLFSLAVEMVHINRRGDINFQNVSFDITLLLLFVVGMFLVNEMILCCHMVFGCLAEAHGLCDGDTEKDDMNYLHDYSALPSSLTYFWMNWLFAVGYKKNIEPNDLGNIPEKHSSLYQHERFKKNFLIEQERALGSHKKISLSRVYWNTYAHKMIPAGILKLCGDCLNLVGPLCISGIVLYVTNALYGTQDENVPSPHHVTIDEFFGNGFVLVGVIYIAALTRNTLDQTYYYICAVEGVHVKSAIQSMVYEKSLRLSTYAMSGGMMTMGQVTNHMSVDAANVQFFFDRGNEVWVAPIRIAVTLVLLYLQLGPPAFIGVAIFFLVIPVQFKIATAYANNMKGVMAKADQRLKSSNEMLQGMKILKLYGWERMFKGFIKVIRGKELDKLSVVYLLAALNFVVNSGTPIIANLLCFSTYTAITGKVLTPDVAFSSLSLLNALTDPMFVLPFVINLFVTAWVSTNRLSFFLSGPEVETKEDFGRQVVEDTMKNGKIKSASYEDHEIQMTKSLTLSYEDKKSYGSVDSRSNREFIPEDVAIRVRDGVYTWDPDSAIPIISDINIDIPAGQLTVIIGTVGSGKSSLLQAMMGEMTTLRGQVLVQNGSTIAYGPQKAWLMNASLKENILFGSSFDYLKYQKVVDACALGPDIAMLPGGDHTEIGEKGINLSGGQKQRVSVARTMYSDRDIVILDDPLSALDMHVGAHLFENGILKILKKQKRTIILVTHQLQYLPEADKIIVMQDGRVALHGDPEEIAKADPSLCDDWQRAMQIFSESEAELSGAESEAILEERKALKKQISQLVPRSRTPSEASESEKGRLMVTEDQEKGSVSYKVYLSYFKSMNYVIAILIIITVLLRAGIQIGTNFWLAIWSEDSLATNDTQTLLDDTNYYVAIYSVLSIGNIVMRAVSIGAITVGCYLAAKNMHHNMLDNIIAIPMRFFDTTPIGRILNRFSTDTQYIDQRLLQTVRTIVNLMSQLLSSFIVIITVSFYFLSFIVPIAIGFVLLLGYYIITSRELQRCESVTRSPVFAHFSETLGGLPTIRAFRDEKRFFQIALDRILQNNRVFLYLVTAQRWVAIRLDYLGALSVLCSSLASLLGAFYFNIDASYVGLAISYSLEISLYMNLVAKSAADLELQMNAVERVQYYTDVPTEDYSGKQPPDSWPDKGQIQLDHISVRYASDLDPVLKGVTLNIPQKEKLGICGRTGSGKSSLTLALFRIIDTFKGRIIIDGIDIATVPLLTLRQRISIIPQDAFLFTGTIRLNLDPTGSKKEAELWNALEIAQLKEVVQQLEGALDYEVTEGGDNFSVGQRQLFCLARAFLRNSTIVVMDEATASIDQETDRLIQDVVSDVFQDRTVLTIAHRVGTILESDTILTLSDGNVIEFDSPSNLLERDDSTFASLVRAGK